LKHHKSPFKWHHFEPTIILLCVRRYCRYTLSYRDLEELVRERGLSVDHTTVWRKRQVERLDGRDSVGQAKFVAGLFGVAAS
jgi:transposase-like protein